MSREMWSQVKRFKDGESLNAKTLNVPIGQLGDRTSFLYSRLKGLLASGKMSAVVLTDVGLVTSPSVPEVGNVVYLDRESGKFAKAKATMSLYDDFTAADSAFSVGILQRRDGDVGDVAVYGSVDLNPDGSPMNVEDMLEEGEEFRSGRYYLSANEAGKMTANPNGPLIYVCSISGRVGSSGNMDGTALVNPQFLDIGTSHVHRTAVLRARPAGTLSTYGYLPLIYDQVAPSKSPALRFGGTWTSDKKSVTYGFWLENSVADWPSGVILRWTEDGKESDDFKVTIHAPDEEVKISNGLTARLSLPGSNKDKAYGFSGPTSIDKRTWAPLEFPAAGKGWLDHETYAIASSDDVDGLAVAVRGRFDAYPTVVNAVFPGTAQILGVGDAVMEEGAVFQYGGKTYEFTKDASSYSGDDIPVSIGTCLADTVLFLVEKLRENGANGLFAVFESDSGASADLIVMDGDEVSVDGSVIVDRDTKSNDQGGFDVVGSHGMVMVVYDGNGLVLGDSPILSDVNSYAWSKAGGISVMVYQTTSVTVHVPTGTIASGSAFDDEPDAAYDYVIGMDQQIAKYWPPVPPKSAALVVNGVEMDNKALLPDNPTVSFGRSTIHWFEDDPGRRPWPELFAEQGDNVNPEDDKTEVMHWVRGFQCATGPVTSLQARRGSPIKFYGYGTDEFANTGDLEAAAEIDFRIENGGAPGYNVPKRARDGALIAGPVVERIVGGAGISVISKAGCPQGQGEVMVVLDNGAYRSHFTDIALENAEQAKIGMFPYIRLKGYVNSITSPSAFTATMRVPTNLPDGKYFLMVYANVFGETGFSGASKQSACVKFSYNILPDFKAGRGMEYSNLKTSLLKPDNDRTVLIPFGHQDSGGIKYNGFDPVLVATNDTALKDESDVVAKVLGGNLPFIPDFALQSVTPELRPGYLVGIRFSRAVTQADDVVPYTGPLGFINLSWSLVSADDFWRSSTSTPFNPLDGVTIKANTADGMRSAIETMGDALGATVIKTRRS